MTELKKIGKDPVKITDGTNNAWIQTEYYGTLLCFIGTSAPNANSVWMDLNRNDVTFRSPVIVYLKSKSGSEINCKVSTW